jgi:hypothetical protein
MFLLIISARYVRVEISVSELISRDGEDFKGLGPIAPLRR